MKPHEIATEVGRAVETLGKDDMEILAEVLIGNLTATELEELADYIQIAIDKED